MKNFPHFFTLALSFFIVFGVSAQSEIKEAQKMVDAEQKAFRFFLDRQTFDENLKKQLQQFAAKETDGIQNNISHLATAPSSRRAKGIRSIAFFMKEMQKQLQEPKFNVYKIPEIVKKFKQTLISLMNNESFEKDFKGIGWRSSQLLANTFWQFDEKKQMADISALKRVIKTPDYIFSFLETKPDYYYTDSLISYMAGFEPDELLSYVEKNNNAVTRRIRSHKSPYVQQLVEFSSNTLATELAPFTEEIVNNTLTVEEILAKRKKVTEYFQLLVNTVMQNEQKQIDGDPVQFQKALRNALHEKALDFYVTKLNDLHNATEAVRFQSVQSLRPQDLYYIIVSADEEMYTSTYLGLYKRLLANFKGSADSVFVMAKNDKFRKFLRTAATYNTITDFLQHMPAEKSREIIHLFISDIEDDGEDEAVADATDIADAFISLSKDSAFNVLVRDELAEGLKNSKKHNLYQSIRLYSILQQVYQLIDSPGPQDDLVANYKSLPLSALKGKDGFVNELVLFYGDDDGKNSFNSFMNLFKDKTQWDVSKNDSWVTATSLQGQPIRIFANLPLSNEEEKDLAAQEALSQYLSTGGIKPGILIHRGHSYHLPNTLKYLQPTVKVAVLGSCGGYKNMKKIMDINPDLHIIASKQVGSMAVNDPLLRRLNLDMSEGKNIDWIVFWNELNESFKTDANAAKLFEEYVPPYKNVSSFVVKLYNYDEDHEDSAGTK